MLVDIIQYIVDLGSYVFVPILMFIIGLIFGLGFLKALKAGATVVSDSLVYRLLVP